MYSDIFVLFLDIRGAISKGDIQMVDLPLNGKPQSNAIGSGLIHAHRHEYGQEWMGCVIDERCFENFPEKQRDQCLSDDKYPIVDYETPYKEDAKSRSNMVIDWTRLPAGIKDEISFFEEKFQRYNKPISSHVQFKIDNTYKFYTTIHRKHSA